MPLCVSKATLSRKVVYLALLCLWMPSGYASEPTDSCYQAPVVPTIGNVSRGGALLYDNNIAFYLGHPLEPLGTWASYHGDTMLVGTPVCLECSDVRLENGGATDCTDAILDACFSITIDGASTKHGLCFTREQAGDVTVSTRRLPCEALGSPSGTDPVLTIPFVDTNTTSLQVWAAEDIYFPLIYVEDTQTANYQIPIPSSLEPFCELQDVGVPLTSWRWIEGGVHIPVQLSHCRRSPILFG